MSEFMCCKLVDS